MVQVDCENLTKEFGSGNRRVVAVDSVDLTIEDGTFVTILGPSGCGKTTLLRMLAGLETPSSGSILFDGDDVTNRSVQDRRIGMVFQNIALFPFKSVRDNIEYGLKYTDAGKDDRREQAIEMAEMLGIEELMDNKPNQLSGGQRQRVALGRALIRDPNVFLLDEPMSDLDAELKVTLRTELKELHKEFRTTTLYVTHDQEEAMTLSEEVIVINDGEIQQMSPPFEIFTEPKNMFVARFIGSPNINFVDATVGEGQIDVDGFERPIEVPTHLIREIEAELGDDDLCIGVRPSALSLVEDDEEAIVETTVDLFEQLGDETILITKMADGTEIRALVPPIMIPRDGESVRFTVEPADVHVFDKTTGKTILNSLEATPDGTVSNRGESQS